MARMRQHGYGSREGAVDGCCGGSCLPPFLAIAWTIGGLLLMVVREFPEPVCIDTVWTDIATCITLGGPLSSRVATWSASWIAAVWLAGCGVLWWWAIARANRAR
jgi:hypothetical protein